ncbi:MAG: NADH-quinone oxidoreductase subunit NuoF [Candidatus Marinimicrobia bacterium]|nr:NADH-quinone oxidoreductase subunit NuoF [Candidatus Neomarinimicrobiota bacterium]
MNDFQPILTKHVGQPGSATLDYYLIHEGYQAARQAIHEMTSDAVIQVVKDSGLQGRGGAGFPTGVKWSFIPRNSRKPKYLINNADESEPGTFKDRLLINHNPHQVIEGMIIASKAIDCHLAFIYIRGEFVKEARLLETALEECRANHMLGKGIFGSNFDLDILVHRGAGAYICGEETGLIESLEGKRGWPRIKPPFPAIEGYLTSPTVVNNVETLANLPHIILNGADWFRAIGASHDSPGPKLYCLSGHVKKPGVYEAPSGIELTELIYELAGGIKDDRRLKAVIPGGSSSPVLTASEIDGLKMDYPSVKAAGSMLGSAGIMVLDETTDMVQVCYNLARFYAHESCGQCTPCREGTTWLTKILRRFTQGQGRREDLDLILEVTDNIGGLIDFSQGSYGKTICPFGEAVAWPVRAFVQKFRNEFMDYLVEDAVA